MPDARITSLRLGLGALIGVTGAFVVSTVLMSRLSDPVIVAAYALGAFLLSLVSDALPSRREAAAWPRVPTAAAMLGGTLALFGAPLLALSQRATDAPPGSESVFFTMSAWGLVSVVIAVVADRAGSRLPSMAAASLACLGGAVLLASWERPSSFSPFVRFAERELWMLVAGALFSAGTLLMLRARRWIGARPTLLLGAAGAALAATVVAAPALGRDAPALGDTWGGLLALAVLGGLFVTSWFPLARAHGLARASGVFFLGPAALTTLTVAERAIWIHGPDPVVWPSALGGIALSAVGVAVLSGAGDRDADAPLAAVGGATSSRGWPTVMRGILPPALAVLALVSLVTPALRADVIGVFGEEYRATWSLPGVETAAGWLVFLTVVLAAVAARARMRGDRRTAFTYALASLAASAAYPFVAPTPLRTATRWIPADVQQTYGTEYARLTFEAVADPIRFALLAGAVFVSLLVIARVVRRPWRDGASEGDE